MSEDAKVNDEEIDAALGAFFVKWRRQMKTAMAIGSVIDELESAGRKVSEERVATRIYDLVAENRLLVFGNVTKWRFSEIVPPEYHQS